MALTTLFLKLVGVGMVLVVKSFIKDNTKPQYVVTVGIGQGGENDNLNGNTPGASLWANTGEVIGGAFGHGTILQQSEAHPISFAGNPR